jgi:hypothetical protein
MRILAQDIFCFIYRNSFNPRYVEIFTGLDYHIMEGKENGNGLTMALLECEFLEFIHYH